MTGCVNFLINTLSAAKSLTLLQIYFLSITHKAEFLSTFYAAAAVAAAVVAADTAADAAVAAAAVGS